MRVRTILVLVVVLLAVVPVSAAFEPNAALDYLRSQQNADGGFGSGFSPESTLGATADVVLAIVSAGGDPAAFNREGNTPLSYLAAQAPSAVTGGDLAKLALAVVAAGENPRQFGGVDAVARLEGLLGPSGKIGGDADTLVGHCLAVLALKGAGQPIPSAAVDYIKSAQQDSGAWAWDGSAATAADTNTTAFAVQALAAAGVPAGDEVVTRALAYYKGIQNEDGGWPYQNPSTYGTATDANSTAVSIQAILAAGQDPAGSGWATAAGSTPMAALEALQNESGAFAWQAAMPDDNLLATVQALPAVAGQAFPLAPRQVAAGTAAVAAPATMPETGGGAGLVLPASLLLGGLGMAGLGLALSRKR